MSSFWESQMGTREIIKVDSARVDAALSSREMIRSSGMSWAQKSSMMVKKVTTLDVSAEDPMNPDLALVDAIVIPTRSAQMRSLLHFGGKYCYDYFISYKFPQGLDACIMVGLSLKLTIQDCQIFMSGVEGLQDASIRKDAMRTSSNVIFFLTKDIVLEEVTNTTTNNTPKPFPSRTQTKNMKINPETSNRIN